MIQPMYGPIVKYLRSAMMAQCCRWLVYHRMHSAQTGSFGECRFSTGITWKKQDMSGGNKGSGRTSAYSTSCVWIISAPSPRIGRWKAEKPPRRMENGWKGPAANFLQ